MTSLSTLATSDKIAITCSRCDRSFGELYRRIRVGFERQCPHCQRIIIFSAENEDPSVKRALKLARTRRNKDREEAETKKLDDQNQLRAAVRDRRSARENVGGRDHGGTDFDEG
jgi:hypothetical protein